MGDEPARILVATDGSEGAHLAVRAAADLSRKTGSELHVVHVRLRLPIQPGLPRSAYVEKAVEEYAELYEEETKQLMRQQASEAEAEGAEVAGTHLREGREAEEMAGLAGGRSEGRRV